MDLPDNLAVEFNRIMDLSPIRHLRTQISTTFSTSIIVIEDIPSETLDNTTALVLIDKDWSKTSLGSALLEAFESSGIQHICSDNPLFTVNPGISQKWIDADCPLRVLYPHNPLLNSDENGTIVEFRDQKYLLMPFSFHPLDPHVLTDLIQNEQLTSHFKSILLHYLPTGSSHHMILISVGFGSIEKKTKKNHVWKSDQTSVNMEKAFTELQIQCPQVWINLLSSTAAMTEWISSFVSKMISFSSSKSTTRNQATVRGVKGTNITNTFHKMLMEIHGCSKSVADAIVEKYPSLILLWKEYDRCKSIQEAEQLLASLSVNGRKTSSCVGKKLSRTIHEMLRSTDPNRLLQP